MLAAAGLFSLPVHAQLAPTALPTGASVVAGSAAINQTGNTLRIDQGSNKAIIDWASFNIGRDAAVRFNQPNAQSVVLNRVGADGGRSLIDGSLSANGQVWLLNPGGALFSSSARVDVGGLLVSSLALSNDDFTNGRFRFNQAGTGSVVNQGRLTAAEGGYIALLAPEVRNEGVISARLGSVALASGEQLRVDFSGDKLIEVVVDQATLNGLVENKHLIQADGGMVLMSTDAQSRLATGAVNNTGIIQAQTLAKQGGKIRLLGGTTTVSGTLDASAPNGGDGGFIETSGGHVSIAPTTRITTFAPQGKTGTWLLDPNDFIIAATGGDITGGTLSAQLASNNVTIQTATMGHSGNGDIFVNDGVSWSSGNQLSLQAERNITINSTINATGSSRVEVSAPGILTINNAASVSAGDISYKADDYVLLGNSFSNGQSQDNSSIGIRPYTATRDIYIESGHTSGVVSLSPSEIATLHVSGSKNLHIGEPWDTGFPRGNLVINASLDSSHINLGTGALELSGDRILVNAGISFGSGQYHLTMDYGGGGIQFNAPVSLTNNNGNSALWLGTHGTSGTVGVTQSTNGGVTVDLLLARGGSVTLDGANTNNIGSVVADVNGSFWIISRRSVVVSAYNDGSNTYSGIRAGNIGLYTTGNLTLNAPLVATGTGAISILNGVNDPLCTGPCVRPHIELGVDGSFTNNVGASAFTLQPGKFWMLTTDGLPSATKLNGLVPDAVSYTSWPTGDILVSANRVFYSLKDTATPIVPPTSATTSIETAVSAQTTPVTSAATADAAIQAPGGTPLRQDSCPFCLV